MKGYSQSTNCSSSSSHSTRNQYCKGVVHPKCRHGEFAFVNICKKQPNVGREFYTCPFWGDSRLRCGFFQWVDEGVGEPRFDEELSSRCEHKQEKQGIEAEIQNLKTENALLKEKLEKLKKKKDILEAEMQLTKEETLKLNLQLVAASNGEKLAYRVVFVTWLFTAIVMAMWFVKLLAVGR